MLLSAGATFRASARLRTGPAAARLRPACIATPRRAVLVRAAAWGCSLGRIVATRAASAAPASPTSTTGAFAALRTLTLGRRAFRPRSRFGFHRWRCAGCGRRRVLTLLSALLLPMLIVTSLAALALLALALLLAALLVLCWLVLRFAA